MSFARLRETEEQRLSRFWSRVNKTNSCWLWTGDVDAYGYGRFPFKGTEDKAHRFAWKLLVGPIAKGLELHHDVCRNTLCVRPEHLKPISKPSHRALHCAEITHCPKGHAYTAENTRVKLRNGFPCRSCRECGRQQWRQWDKNRKAAA